MMKRPSGVRVRKPAQPLLMLTPDSAGMNRSIFSASISFTLSSIGGSPGGNSVWSQAQSSNPSPSGRK